MRISFVATVLNEEKTIHSFLKSLGSQSRFPDEIIIVDGGSTDATASVISNLKSPHFAKASRGGQISNKQIKFKFITKKGNRSAGRNEAIKRSSNEIIVCSDAGCVLDKEWVENITKPFKDKSVDVVAGYYKGKPRSIFEKCLIPYVLVMPDKVHKDTFLPASRSMAFRKSVWEKVGGFPEEFSNNEDYVFAHKLKNVGAKIVFEKKAIVNWIPRKNLKEAFVMFFRFAKGDAEAGIFRSNVLLVLARYLLGLYIVFLSILYKSFMGAYVLFISLLLYTIWFIKKNYRYINNKQAIQILPFLQFTADFAVLTGTTIGLLRKIVRFNYFLYIKQNKFLFFIMFAYVFVMLLTLKWGIPNKNHPFPYHMDEWHQLHAVGTTFKYGTPNTEGSANGTMFHFLLSGFYLAPFTLLHLINPFGLKIDDFIVRERLFEILRLNTILYGALSIFVIYKITQVIKASSKLTLFLFTFTPIWLSLSGYFKYDIALLFWILFSIFFLIRFGKDPSNRNYLLAVVPSSLAIAVKVSAVPLFFIYIFSYFWFNPSWKRNFKYFFMGVSIFIGCILVFGMPDILFGKGNIFYYLYDNIIHSPKGTSNFQLGINPFLYLFLYHYRIIFGNGLVLLFAISVLFWIWVFLKAGLKRSIKKFRAELFLFFSLLVFILSILPLQIYAVGNRSLVVLPFLVLIISLAFKKMLEIQNIRKWIMGLIVLVVVAQLYESFAWVYIKLVRSPQEISSSWIEKNIQKNQTIGIENIPIYQLLPDIIQKEFYFNQYNVKQENRYTYQIIDSRSNRLPSVIILTNGETEAKLLKKSPKKNLIKRLEREGYKKLAVFYPDFTYYKIYATEIDYYLSGGLVMSPVITTVFMK